MFRSRSLAAACAAALAVLSSSHVHACPEAHTLPLGSLLKSAITAADCPPADCQPASTGAPGTLDSAGGIPFDISMADFAFLPAEPIIKPLTTVRWTNNGFFQHTTTRSGRWNSGLMNPGQFFDHLFSAEDAGQRFDYVCTLHFGMEGAIRVAYFGDANLDGIVNLADFNVLAANFGQSERAWDSGDFNGDGLVNLADFNLLAANFGREVALQGAPDIGALIPEPSAAALGAAGAVLLARRRPLRVVAA